MMDQSALGTPSVTEIDAIAAMPDGAMRNLWITWSYYRLNEAMVAITGRRDLSWCGFAVWASKTAGTFIRRQEMGPLIDEWIDSAAARAGAPTMLAARALGLHHPHAAHEPASGGFSIRRFAATIIGQVGDDIGAGNQDVFHHIAPPFARLVELWRTRNGTLGESDRTAFIASLDNPADPQRQFLVQAFTAMFDAIAAGDERRRAQLMLQANALVGCAEQTRVQPFIARSMSRPIADLFRADLAGHLHDRFLKWIADIIQWLLKGLEPALNAAFQDLSTRLMMTLSVPGANLRLGEPVPPLPDGRMYPPDLVTLDSPEPAAVVASLDATDAARSAARDWVDYNQRMRYIAVLFRSRQQERALWDAPFTEAQVAQLKSGRMPNGTL